MTKKYFAKYLSVKGIIKKGDIVMDSDGMQHYALDSWVGKEDVIGVLSLCSRDIQAGDKVRALDTPHIEFIWDKGGLEGAVRANSLDLYFKVIGEISPNAIWVKEGDEFEENEVKITNHIKVLPPHNFSCKIKCPTCKTFH